MYLVEGVRAVDELVNWQPDSICALFVNIASVQVPAVVQSVHLARVAGVPCEILPSDLFEPLTDTETSQGLIALSRQQTLTLSSLVARKPQFVVVSDQIQDPGNLGTIVRIADAVGADGFIAAQGSADLHNPKTVRAAMGSLFHLPHCKDVGILEVCETLGEAGLNIIAADASGASVHFDVSYSKPLAVIFGNEGAGISPGVMNFATPVRIPMPGSAESLNVAVAAGVMLYEMLRQWRGSQ